MTRIFISHSHSDEAIIHKLVNFLLAALRIEEEEIFCSSNPDQGLDYRFIGIPDQLKEKLKNSEALIVLITAHSLHSAWIPFEVGTFWTTDKPVIPILGLGLIHDDLPGPLRSLLSISIEAKDWSDKVNNAIKQLSDQLQIQQKVTKRRKDTLQEFSDSLKAWQSKRPVPVSQEEVEQLRAQIQELEQQLSSEGRSHQQQLQEQKQSCQNLIEKKESEINRWKYIRLEKLLAASRWEEADQETAQRMLEVINNNSWWDVAVKDIENFPCEDLKTIDQLWVYYSNRRFGFSVQKEIYLDLHGTKEYTREIWWKFADRVGWRKGEKWLNYSELIFKLHDNTPRGHLPRMEGDRAWGEREQGRGKIVFGRLILSRTDLQFSNQSLVFG